VEVYPLVQLDWAHTFSRACGILGRAIASVDGSKAIRLSFSHWMDIDTIRMLSNNWNPNIVSVAARLQCLSLGFADEVHDLDTRTQAISPIFLNIFKAARNLVAIHIGFYHNPLSIPLEDVFPNVHMENLKIFSIRGWCLHADEVIAFARRHRQTLEGMRLGVLLKDGPWWKEVLPVLREEMPKLRWLSLWKAGYKDDVVLPRQNVDEGHHDSESSDEDDTDDYDDEHIQDDEGSEDIAWSDLHEVNDELDEDEDEVDTESLADSINIGAGPGEYALQIREDEYVCTCANIEHTYVSEDLGDNGTTMVTQASRKMWESWVIGCQVHRERFHGTARQVAS
jgi:hypothetical protein